MSKYDWPEGTIRRRTVQHCLMASRALTIIFIIQYKKKNNNKENKLKIYCNLIIYRVKE